MAYGYDVGGQGIRIGIGDFNHDGQVDVDFGLRGYHAYGNGAYGGYDSTEVGFGTSRGVYVEGDSGRYSPWAQQNSHWGADAWGSHSSSNYSDVFGNYSHNRYAQDVFGNYSGGHAHGDMWHQSSTDYGGNYNWGVHGQSSTYSDVFGNFGHSSFRTPPFVPGHGHGHYHGHGGGQVAGWFNFGCFG